MSNAFAGRVEGEAGPSRHPSESWDLWQVEDQAEKDPSLRWDDELMLRRRWTKGREIPAFAGMTHFDFDPQASSGSGGPNSVPRSENSTKTRLSTAVTSSASASGRAVPS